MKSRTRKKSNKKALWITLLVVCLLLAAVGGTIAWLTAQDSLTNKFAVGNFNDPTGPTDDVDSDFGEDENDSTKLNGHLYEPSWDEDSAKIMPGLTIAKDPKVGIGPGSEDAYVYINVDNTINKITENGPVYFKIDTDNWEPVSGCVAVFNGNVTDTEPGYEVGTVTYYTGGLFKYKSSLTTTENTNAWTSSLFENVYVKSAYDVEEINADGNIEVTALLHQEKDNEDNDLSDTADEWAKQQMGFVTSP